MIGPGGSTIRSLEERNHVRIRVTEDAHSSDKKTVTVSGDDKSGVDSAIAEIKVLAVPRAAPGPRTVPADHVTDTVDIPSESVGMVIGAKGATIRRLQEKFGCSVNVARGSHGETTPVTVSGPDSTAVANTIDEIRAVIAPRDVSWSTLSSFFGRCPCMPPVCLFAHPCRGVTVDSACVVCLPVVGACAGVNCPHKGSLTQPNLFL